MRKLLAVGIALVALGSAALAAPTAPAQAASPAIGFTTPQFVDNSLGGGEPFVIASPKFHTLVFSSHEGTTHIYRNAPSPFGIQQFLCPLNTNGAICYANHVNIWTSTDNSKTWKVSDEGYKFTGFSDPDLTTDAGGTIYNTGIDLVNDAVFSSSDGGMTWPDGTSNCHEGDRPWLAGGKAGTVFLATNASQGGHSIWRSVDKGNTCGSVGISDQGGLGKIYYDHVDGSLIEPKRKGGGLAIARQDSVDAAFDKGSSTFVDTMVTPNTTMFAHWPSITIDSAENVYMVWDTNPTQQGSSGGCNGGPTPLPNQVMLAVGRHVSQGRWIFNTPVAVASPSSARVYWPWVQVGDPGNVSVVWYQTDKVDDLDCDQINGQTVNATTTIYAASIFGALDPASFKEVAVNASGRFIHQGGVCQSGTTCEATGQDRRIGDFFTNALDENGCVMIGSGDTTMKDPLGQELLTARPIFIRQNSGPGLTGRDCATGQPLAAATVSSPAPQPTPSPLPNTGRPGPFGPGLLIAGLVTATLALAGRAGVRRGA